MQLNIRIFVFRSSDKEDKIGPFTHWEILLPARNWIEPNNPPLWASSPLIPILKNKSDPDPDPTVDDAANLNTIKIKTGDKKLKVTL